MCFEPEQYVNDVAVPEVRPRRDSMTKTCRFGVCLTHVYALGNEVPR